MLCQKCGQNTATTHIKTIINGTVSELNLCGYCAAKEGYNSFAKGSVSNMLASMLGQTMSMGERLAEKSCDCCGLSFSEIAETGKVGCANCYVQFKSELTPYLKRIHGSVRHNGKIPGTKQLVVTKSENRIADLKAELARLVAAEKYEEAAVVRDKIREEEGKA